MFSRAMAASSVKIRSLSSSIEEQASTPTPASPEPEAGSGGRPEPASWRSELTPEEKSPRASLESGGPLPQSHAHSVCAWSRYVATAGTKPAHIVGCRPLPLRPPPGAKNNTSQNLCRRRGRPFFRFRCTLVLPIQVISFSPMAEIGTYLLLITYHGKHIFIETRFDV